MRVKRSCHRHRCAGDSRGRPSGGTLMLREWTRRCGGVSRGTAFRTPPRCRHPHGGVASSALGDQALHGRTFVVPILAGATRWPAHGAVARDAAPQRGIAAAVRGDWCGLPRDSRAAAVAVLLGVPGLFFLAQGRSLTRPRRNVPRGLGDRSDESRASYVLLSGAYGRIAGAWCGVYLRWSSRALLTAPRAWTFARRAEPVTVPRESATTRPAPGTPLAFNLVRVAGVGA